MAAKALDMDEATRKAMEEPTMDDRFQKIIDALEGVQKVIENIMKRNHMEMERREKQQEEYIRTANNSVHQEMDRRFPLFPFVKPETGVPPQAVATPAVQTPIVEPIHEPAVQRMIDVIDKRTATHQPPTASPPPSAPPSPARAAPTVESSCLPDISKDVWELKDQFKTISLNLGLEGNSHRTARDRESRARSPTSNEQPRSNWRSTSPNPRSSSPSINCYNCGLEGHLIRDCPRRKGGGSPPRQRNRSRSPSPATSRSASSLN